MDSAILGTPIADTGVELPEVFNGPVAVRNQIPAATFQHQLPTILEEM